MPTFGNAMPRTSKSNKVLSIVRKSGILRPRDLADGRGVSQDPGLDGFVFSGCGHEQLCLEFPLRRAIVRVFSASGSRTYKGPRRASLVKSAVFFCPHGIHLGEVLSFARVRGVSAT